MTDEIQVPARALALSEKIGDAPISWKEHDDGSVTIVFCNKGKQKFEKIEQLEEIAESYTVIRTKAEAEEVVKTLTPKHEPSPKRRK